MTKALVSVDPSLATMISFSTAPKSNSSGAYFKAFQLIEEEGKTGVPTHLKDANRDREALGHGENYQYPHNEPEHFLPQQYLPRDVLGTYFYRPSEQGYEAEIVERLERWRKAQRKALGIETSETLPELSEDEIQEIKGKHKASR